MVEYIDHSIIAQISVPDMRHCVQYALTHPHRLPAGDTLPPADLFARGTFTFGRPDGEAFPLLPLALDCIKRGGALPCALNAANEVVVAAFLANRVCFAAIPELVARTVADMTVAADCHTYEEILNIDREARVIASSLVASAAV